MNDLFRDFIGGILLFVVGGVLFVMGLDEPNGSWHNYLLIALGVLGMMVALAWCSAIHFVWMHPTYKGK